MILFMSTKAVLQVPGGPAHNHLEPGDILIRINGEVSMSRGACKAAYDNFSWLIRHLGEYLYLL